MKPIPFDHTWPYEKQMGDIYLASCPYCSTDNVLTNLSSAALGRAKEQVKVRVNMPCCHKTMIVLEADEDYFWTTEKLR
ncbi:hypothetical protein CR203_20495 [Salipaludibacillus neizhouensis]|uniref:Uncharacterized protein n=1 Tax=Salipaludibacillus neizhouensis TaxID=885475 RepID=A0A3A9JZ44_9BACI|nr:hypothetical protein [Salipaludibacillus neizhouensis]RKL65459.1 hypothetical protein CR203_20495 [Salipaludibacillus neizhouensis]